MRKGRLFAPVLLLFASCGATDGNASFQVRESVEQLAVTHAPPGIELGVLDQSGALVKKGTTDALGSLVFRTIPPKDGYVVLTTGAMPAIPEESRHLQVKSVSGSQPSTAFYSNQKLVAGFNYITTRDGTTLSAYVTLPGPIENGPYPTVVDYSGYAPSQPGAPIPGFGFLCDALPIVCDAPNDPSALLAGLFGYATVSVNIRGTGCSGGAYDFFETLQLLDGYDVIEAVAAQPWVAFHKVGMVGISYPGISQLFVARLRPPGLAAILPVSVIGNITTTMAPGGILNDGFALQWVNAVLDRAAPYGQGWERARVDGGDTVCAENQLLHAQRIDNVAQAQDPRNLTAAIVDPLNPTLFSDQIEVPVFLASAFQDDQTGPFFTTLLDRFKRSPLVRETVYNGVHVDGYAPPILIEWKNFLDLFVARKLPVTQKLVRDLSPQIFHTVFYTSSMKLPADRFAGYASYEEALAAYQKEPSVRAIFESGVGDPAEPGAPVGSFEEKFAAWPPPSTKTERFYLHEGGTLTDAMPTEPTEKGASDSFQLDPDAGARGNLAANENPWALLPKYDWRQPQSQKAIVFETATLTKDQLMLGTGSVDLFLQSTAGDADLQVTLSEVRPDGKEMFVQSGWLRASYRALATDATDLWPDHTLLYTDIKPLPAGEWTLVRVPIAGFGHAFRAGSRIRLIIDTPGGTRADWRFALAKFPGGASHSIALSAAHPSSVALPLLDGAAVPTPLPACTVRAQPCRDYQPFANTPAK